MILSISVNRIPLEKSDLFYIYSYLRDDGSPYYIGKGCDYRAWKKHKTINTPKDKSKIVIMESNLTELGALALERFYIRWYGRIDNNTGILRNKTDGGEGISGYKFSDTHKNKIRIALTGLKRKPMSDDQKRFLSEINSGKNNPNYGKKRPKHSEFMKLNNPFKGKKHTESTINKLAKEYHFINPNGEKIKIFNLQKFCRENGLNSSLMNSVWRGDRNHHKGYKRI